MTAMTTFSPRKIVATVAIAATIGGSAFALSTVLPAGAQTGPSTASSAAAAGAGGPRAKAKAALDGLVTDGTIDQSQEDAVIAALQGAIGGRGGPRVGPRARGILEKAAQVAADKIGVSVDDLKAALKDGKSIADVANEHSVSPADVQQALVDAATAKLNEAVTNGKVTQDQADKIEQRLPTTAEKVVNHHKGDKGPGA
jgi:hypothetical protein